VHAARTSVAAVAFLCFSQRSCDFSNRIGPLHHDLAPRAYRHGARSGERCDGGKPIGAERARLRRVCFCGGIVCTLLHREGNAFRYTGISITIILITGHRAGLVRSDSAVRPNLARVRRGPHLHPRLAGARKRHRLNPRRAARVIPRRIPSSAKSPRSVLRLPDVGSRGPPVRSRRGQQRSAESFK
jgi:hypothetical protein